MNDKPRPHGLACCDAATIARVASSGGQAVYRLYKAVWVEKFVTPGGLALHEQRGQRYMQEIGRRGGQNGVGDAKRRPPARRKWWNRT